MSDGPSDVRTELRTVRRWIPWLVICLYFPLYLVVDQLAGGAVASAVGFPRSVSVGLCSLSLTLVATGSVVATKVDRGSLLRAVDPRLDGRQRDRSTVGAEGVVDRRPIETRPWSSSRGRDALAGEAMATADEVPAEGENATGDWNSGVDEPVTNDGPGESVGEEGRSEQEAGSEEDSDGDSAAAAEADWPDGWVSADEV